MNKNLMIGIVIVIVIVIVGIFLSSSKPTNKLELIWGTSIGNSSNNITLKIPIDAKPIYYSPLNSEQKIPINDITNNTSEGMYAFSKVSSSSTYITIEINASSITPYIYSGVHSIRLYFPENYNLINDENSQNINVKLTNDVGGSQINLNYKLNNLLTGAIGEKVLKKKDQNTIVLDFTKL